MYYIVYLSTSTKLFTNDELMALLYKSRINNARAGVTGMLMYSQGTFFQTIEGEEDVVNNLFEKIKQDTRHHNIIKLKSGYTATRSFPGWELAFTSSITNDYSPIADFVNPVGHAANSNHENNPAISLMQCFAINNSLQQRPL